MIIALLVGLFVLALANTCVLSIAFRKQISPFTTTLFYSVVIANFGSLALALSKSYEGALFATKITYLGASFLPLLFLLIILNICKFNMPRPVTTTLFAFSATVFALSCTIGHSDIYYKSFQYVSENGIGNYVAEFGPTHILWTILLNGFTLANFIVIFYAAKKKKNVSFKKIVALALLEVATVVIFTIAAAFNNDTIVMPLIYTLDEFIILYICLHAKMYDIGYSVLEALEKGNDNAYIAFSKNGKYLGCNDVATQYFPELANNRVDHPLKDNGEVSKIFNDILKNNTSLKKGGELVFTNEGKHYKLELQIETSNLGSEKYLFLVEDITKTEQYIQWLSSNNTELETKVEDNKKQIHALQEQIIVGMAKMVESRDSNTGGHIKRTSDVVAILAKEMRRDMALNYGDDFYNALIAAAPMHDLGKIAIDDSVLRKPGKFTPEEFEEMKTHAAKGAAIVENLLSSIDSSYFVDIAKNVAMSHHERWDGSGYPNKISGTDIPVEARIMAIADVYDALVSKRCYKDKMSFEVANKIITESMGTHFDPSLKKYYDRCRPALEAYYSSIDS